MLLNLDHLKTFYSAIKHKMKSFRGNWDQDDPTADDYIKNRPFYEKIRSVITVNPKTELDFSYANTCDWDQTKQGFIHEGLGEFEFAIKLDTSYTVVFDGKEYNLFAVQEDEYSNIILGNGAFVGDANKDNGLPFVIGNYNLGTEYTYIIVGDNRRHSFEVKIVDRDLKKLDKKYLPDDLAEGFADVAKTGSYSDLVDAPEVYPDVVRYNNTQDLTEVQKASARYNIGAGTSNFSGSYNDLTDKTHSKNTTSIQLPYYSSIYYNVDQVDVITNFASRTPDTAISELLKNEEIYAIYGKNMPLCYYRGRVIEKFTGHNANGETRECTCVYYVFGNGSLFNAYSTNTKLTNITGYEDFTDTGERLCYAIGWFDYYPSERAWKKDALSTIWLKKTGTLKVNQEWTGRYYTYDTLDENFIPDTIARTSDIPSIEGLATTEYVDSKVGELADSTTDNIYNAVISSDGKISITTNGAIDTSDWTDLTTIKIYLPYYSMPASTAITGLYVDNVKYGYDIYALNPSQQYPTKIDSSFFKSFGIYELTLLNGYGNNWLITNHDVMPTKVSALENDAGYVTENDVKNTVNEVIDAAPEALNTLNELAAALGDDPNFAATIATNIGKVSADVDKLMVYHADYTNPVYATCPNANVGDSYDGSKAFIKLGEYRPYEDFIGGYALYATENVWYSISNAYRPGDQPIEYVCFGGQIDLCWVPDTVSFPYTLENTMNSAQGQIVFTEPGIYGVNNYFITSYTAIATKNAALSISTPAPRATTADRLTTTRTISLSGDVTGSANFDGRYNVSITATVKDNSHNHTIDTIDGLNERLANIVPVHDLMYFELPDININGELVQTISDEAVWVRDDLLNGNIEAEFNLTDGKLSQKYCATVSKAATKQAISYIEVYSQEDLEGLANQNNGYQLMNDIELDENFESIPNFGGSLDGNGYAIRGLTKPLFAYFDEHSNVYIANLELSGAIDGDQPCAYGSYSDDSAGAIVAYCMSDMIGQGGVTLNNVVSHVTVTSATNAGGLIGTVQGFGVNIMNCFNYGYVHGYANAGGFIGKIRAATVNIQNSVNEGEVYRENTSGVNVGGGGFIGYGATYSSIPMNLNVTSCINKGYIHTPGTASGQNGDGGIGGIFGSTGWADNTKENISITKCANYGEVKITGSNRGRAAGIAGRISKGAAQVMIEYCYNLGTITGGIDTASGVLGYTAAPTTLRCCYNAGELIGNRYPVGGHSGAKTCTQEYNYFYTPEATYPTAGGVIDATITGSITDLNNKLLNIPNTKYKVIEGRHKIQSYTGVYMPLALLDFEETPLIPDIGVTGIAGCYFQNKLYSVVIKASSEAIYVFIATDKAAETKVSSSSNYTSPILVLEEGDLYAECAPGTTKVSVCVDGSPYKEISTDGNTFVFIAKIYYIPGSYIHCSATNGETTLRSNTFYKEHKIATPKLRLTENKLYIQNINNLFDVYLEDFGDSAAQVLVNVLINGNQPRAGSPIMEYYGSNGVDISHMLTEDCVNGANAINVEIAVDHTNGVSNEYLRSLGSSEWSNTVIYNKVDVDTMIAQYFAPETEAAATVATNYNDTITVNEEW